MARFLIDRDSAPSWRVALQILVQRLVFGENGLAAALQCQSDDVLVVRYTGAGIAQFRGACIDNGIGDPM